jgi:hypothetical protein
MRTSLVRDDRERPRRRFIKRENAPAEVRDEESFQLAKQLIAAFTWRRRLPISSAALTM